MSTRETTSFGNISASKLAEIYGTPLLVIDGAVLTAAIDEFVSASASTGVQVTYAGKALLLVGIAQLLKESRLRLEVCSLGELTTAQRAGFPPSRIDLHGSGKTDAELRAAADGAVSRTIVDGIAELRALASYASPSSPVAILMRINSGIEARTHAFVRTAGDQTKFGITPRDFSTAARIIQDNAALNFRGLHSHIGSQVSDAKAFIRNAARLVDAAARLKRLGLSTSDLVVGGGFAVRSRPSERAPLDVKRTIASIAQEVRKRSKARGIVLPTVGIEPGRALIAPAGTLLYRVMARKRQGRRTFVIVDGGMADNPRPALYGAHPDAKLAGRRSNVRLEMVTICGRSCENDFITDVRLARDVTVGDILAMPMTGAYTYSMASNYNRFPRPAVVYAHGGNHQLMARRETIDDVLRGDVGFLSV